MNIISRIATKIVKKDTGVGEVGWCVMFVQWRVKYVVDSETKYFLGVGGAVTSSVTYGAEKTLRLTLLAIILS